MSLLSRLEKLELADDGTLVICSHEEIDPASGDLLLIDKRGAGAGVLVGRVPKAGIARHHRQKICIDRAYGREFSGTL
jgi:hypothetical protein